MIPTGSLISRMLRRLFLLSVVLCFAELMAPTVSYAQTRPTSARPAPSKSTRPPAMQGRVSVEVMVVHANHGNRVDPELRSVMQNLKFTRYSGFSLLGKYPAQLSAGEESSFQIAGGRRLKVKLIERDGKQAKIRVRMLNQSGKVLDTTVSIHRNRSFMVAGPKHNNGVLIIPVSVRY